MPFRITLVFQNRPYISDRVYLSNATSVMMEHVDDSGKVCPPPAYVPEVEPDRVPTRVTAIAPAGYVRRSAPKQDQTPSGSFPTFDVPKTDGSVAQAVLDDADYEGYHAYLEAAGDPISPAEVMSPYPAGSLCDRAWKNGYARADHSDARDDDDGM